MTAKPTPITDSLEASIEAAGLRDVPVRVYQRMRALESDRAELVAALREIEATCHPVNTVYSWDERQRKTIGTARALLAKLGEQ